MKLCMVFGVQVMLGMARVVLYWIKQAKKKVFDDIDRIFYADIREDSVSKRYVRFKQKLLKEKTK